jgi:23S rRNA-/tRNA-specific pseudouridylate synthase
MAQKLHEQIRNRTVVKEYVCRVEGLFPEYVLFCNYFNLYDNSNVI